MVNQTPTNNCNPGAGGAGGKAGSNGLSAGPAGGAARSFRSERWREGASRAHCTRRAAPRGRGARDARRRHGLLSIYAYLAEKCRSSRARASLGRWHPDCDDAHIMRTTSRLGLPLFSITALLILGAHPLLTGCGIPSTHSAGDDAGGGGSTTYGDSGSSVPPGSDGREHARRSERRRLDARRRRPCARRAGRSTAGVRRRSTRRDRRPTSARTSSSSIRRCRWPTIQSQLDTRLRAAGRRAVRHRALRLLLQAGAVRLDVQVGFYTQVARPRAVAGRRDDHRRRAREGRLARAATTRRATSGAAPRTSPSSRRSGIDGTSTSGPSRRGRTSGACTSRATSTSTTTAAGRAAGSSPTR